MVDNSRVENSRIESSMIHLVNEANVTAITATIDFPSDSIERHKGPKIP